MLDHSLTLSPLNAFPVSFKEIIFIIFQHLQLGTWHLKLLRLHPSLRL